MAVFVLSLLLIVTSYFQLSTLLKKQLKKEAAIYVSLMLIAAYLSIGSIIDLYIPNPTNGIRLLFKPIQQFVNKLLS